MMWGMIAKKLGVAAFSGVASVPLLIAGSLLLAAGAYAGHEVTSWWYADMQLDAIVEHQEKAKELDSKWRGRERDLLEEIRAQQSRTRTARRQIRSHINVDKCELSPDGVQQINHTLTGRGKTK